MAQYFAHMTYWAQHIWLHAHYSCASSIPFVIQYLTKWNGSTWRYLSAGQKGVGAKQLVTHLHRSSGLFSSCKALHKSYFSTLRLFSCPSQLARANLGKTTTFFYVFQFFAIFYEGLEILGIFWGQVLWYWNEPGGHGAVPSPGSNSHTSLTGTWKRSRLESNPGEKITWGRRIARGWGRDDRGGCCDWELYLLTRWLLVILLCEINILLWEYGKKMIKV